jgi:protease-4
MFRPSRFRFSFLLWAVGCTAAVTACPGPRTTAHKKAKKTAKHGHDVAVMTLTGPLVEDKSLGDLFGPKVMTLRRTLKTLRKAARDSRIGTVLLRVGALQTGWAQLADLRAALKTIQRAKKKVVVHLDEPGNGAYYLAVGADEIQISAASSVWMIGLSANIVFVKGLLDKLGVKADMVHVGKYKSAAEPLTRKTPSPEMKKALSAMLDGMYAELVTAVAEGRNLAPDAVKKIIDSAPVTAKEALQQKLVDRIGELRAYAKALAGGSAKVHWNYGKKKKAGTWSGLLELLQPDKTGKPPKSPHVALVYAVGPIVYGDRQSGLLGNDELIASNVMVKTLDRLRTAEKVKAVLLRIDSPGGSALASDIIWASLRRLAAVKPVIVSMGDVAASGGYYLASAATKIYAQPLSLTGSIGVVGGKIALGGLYGKLGITETTLTRGAQADFFSSSRPFSENERQKFEALMKNTYDTFVARVASGRKMSRAKVERAAQGRVWIGRRAKALGLVDELGGLYDALAEARKLGKLPEDAKVTLYPRPKSWLQELQERLGSPGVSLSGAGLGGVAPPLAMLSALDARVYRYLVEVVCLAAGWKKEPIMAVMPYWVQVR